MPGNCTSYAGLPSSRDAAGRGDNAAGNSLLVRLRAVARGQRRALAVAITITVTSTLPVVLVGTLAVQIRSSLDLSTDLLGATITGYYLGAALTSVPLGHLAERLGGIRVMRAGAVVAAVLLACTGAFAHSWPVLGILLVLSGMMSAGIAPATNLFLARRMNPASQGAAFGLKQAAVPIASLLGGVAVPAVALTVGWRWAFEMAALLALAGAVAAPSPTVPVAGRRRRGTGSPRDGSSIAPLVLFGAGLGLGVLATSGLTAFVVIAAVHLGFSNGVAGLVAALGGAAAAAVRIGIGFYADRTQRNHFGVIATMLVAGALGFVMLSASMRTGEEWLFVLGVVVALGAGWGYNGLLNFAVVASHRDAPARATGITQVGGRVGGVLGPLTVALVGAHSSFSDAWLVAGAAGVLGALSVVAGKRLLPVGTPAPADADC